MSNTIGSSTVDERIVEMRIDNAKFEAGAKKTISILESLDRNLKGISEENVDGFDNIGKSLDKVTDRFSAFGIVGDQVMRNLTNRAMEMVSQVKNMTTMLTTQQIGAGWNKYADKTSAIQTIMAATSGKISDGTFADQAEQLEWVNEQIEKLNKFTDETSYNFLDMVGNIGKFTAAGRELEESVTAMEGIANWAAISGGRPAEASRAMYNLSQALGMGKVTQLDWKSIENANMATYEFKQQVIDVAEEMGTLKKIADGIWEDMDGHEVTVESFRENLKDGWFDSDVLLKVLNRYGEFSDVLLNVSDATGKTATEILHQIKAFKETGRVADWLSPYIQELTKDEYELGLRAFQAAQEAKTFTEAIDATKDAVSTKWMTVFELLFGNYLEAKELWTDMAETFWDIFAAPVDRLIEIIENAGGFIGKDGFTGSMEQAAGGTALLESSLQAAGKTMDDFYKALEEHTGSARFKALEFAWGSIEEALKGGAVSAEEFRGALSKLDSSYDTAKTVSLDRALLHAGKTMDDFEKSIMQVGGPAALEMVKNFGSVEEALRQGGVWADLFRQALNNIGIDSENVTQNIEETVQHSVASLEEMRQFALEVLRGDHGNGEERLAWYESMGLDAELMQAMAGNLHHIGQDISDEYLMELMEIYYQAQGLSERLGYATFAEYIASRQEAMEGYVDSMEELASKSEGLYASLFGEGILNEAGEYYSAGELFRKSITNLLEALRNFGEAFDKAFMKVFGGSTKEEEQIQNMSDGFFTLTAAFYSFSEKIKNFSESETLLNFMTALFSTLRMIGNALSLVFKIGKTGLGFVLKLLSPIFTLVSGVFDAISFGIEALSDSFNNSGIPDLIDSIGNDLLAKIAEPIDKINTVISALISAFKEGFSEGGMMGGFDKMMEALDTLFQNHPVFLTIAHTVGQALIYLGDAVAGAAMVLGGVLGGAVSLLIAGFQQLGIWISEFIDKAKQSPMVMDIWNSITKTFAKLGNVIQRVFSYAQQGYQEGGFFGALSAIGESLERGIRRLLPGGEALMNFFGTIADFFGGSGKGGSAVIRTKKAITDFQQPADKLRESFAKLKDATPIGVRGIEKVGEAVDKIAPKLTRAAKVVETVSDGMFGDEEAKKTLKERVAAFIQTLWDGVLEGLRKITIKDVIGAMRLSLIASIVSKLMSAITIFTDIKNSIKTIPETLSKVGEKFANMMQGLAVTFTANAVLKFAAAAVLLGFVLAKLAKIPKEDLTHAASTLIVILGVLALLAKGLGQMKMGTAQILGKIPNMTGVLIGLSAFILSLGSVMTVLMIISHFTPETLKPVADTLGNMLLFVAALMAICLLFAKIIEPEKLRTASQLIWAVGGAMMLIGTAVRKLAFSILMLSAGIKLAGSENFNKAAQIVGLMLGAFAIMAALLIGVADNFSDKELLAVGQMFLRIAAAMVVVAFAMQMLAVPIIAMAVAATFMPGKIDTAAGAIALIFLLVSLMGLAFAAFLNKADYVNMEMIGNTLLKIAATMTIAAVAMTIMVVPIKKMAELCAKVNKWDIFTGIMMLLGTVAAIGMLLTHWSKNTDVNGGGGLIKVAAAIALIALAMRMLAPAMVILANAVGFFAGKLSEMDKDTWKKFSTGLWRLVGLSAALAVFGLALLAIGVGGIAAGSGFVAVAGGIFLLIAAIATLMFALPSFIKTLKDLKDTSFKELGKSLLKVAVAVGAFTLGFTVMLLLLNKLFKYLSGDNLGKIGRGFGRFIKGLVTGAKNGAKNGFDETVKTLKDPANRAKITNALAVMLGLAFGYVTDLIPTFTENVIGGLIKLIDSIATELDNQGGALVDSLVHLGNSIAHVIMDAAAAIFGEASWEEMDWWKKGVVLLLGGLLAVGRVAGALNLTKPFTDLKTVLTGGGGVARAAGTAGGKGGLIGFITKLTSAIYNAQYALDGMYMGSSSASWGAAAGTAGLAGLAAAAGVYGVTLWDAKLSADYTTKALEDLGITADDVSTKALELASTWQKGEEALYDYTGASTVSYQEGRYAAAALAKMLDTTVEHLEAEMQATKGDITQTQVYKDAIQRVTQSQLEAVEAKRDYIAELQALDDEYRNSNSVKESTEIQNEYNSLLTEAAMAMGTTSRELDAMIRSYRSADTEIEEIGNTATETASEIESASNAGIDFIDALEAKAAEMGFSRDTLLTDIGGDKLNELFNSVGGEFGFDMSDVDVTGIAEFEEMLGGIGEQAGPFLPEGIGVGMTLGDVLEGLKGDSDSVGKTIFDELSSYFKIGSPSRLMADEIGRWIPPGIGAGITEHQNEATTPVIMLVQEMLHMVQSGEHFFETCGRNVVVGLANGISNNLQIAYQAGQNVASSVENGFRDKLSIRSPSRVFAELARFIPLGVAEGIDDGSTSAISSVTVLGSALIDAIMGSMAMVSAAADDEFEITPYIRPVVDLSNVKNASGLVNSVFGESYGLSGEIGTSISRRMQQTRLNVASRGDSGSTVNSNDNITINIYAHEGMDENAVADAVMERMGSRYARRGMAFG